MGSIPITRSKPSTVHFPRIKADFVSPLANGTTIVAYEVGISQNPENASGVCIMYQYHRIIPASSHSNRVVMFSSLLKPRACLDEETTLWLFDTFAWALRNLGGGVFYDETILVTPSNQHFPGTETSAHGMANLIFSQVKEHAGMKHWPTKLTNLAGGGPSESPKIEIKGALRGSKGIMPAGTINHHLPIVYNPGQLRDPEVLIADYAHALAHYLASTSKEPPPGGVENWPHITEVVAVFLGFGLMMANSANTVKIRSCGSCSGPAVERSNALSQYDITYALAIFSCLKEIPPREVLTNLKKTLRPFYKKAAKEVVNKKEELERVRQFSLRTLDQQANPGFHL